MYPSSAGRGLRFQSPRFLFVGALVALTLGASPAGAQKYRISQRGTVSQMLGGTRVALDYSRPLTRGRSDVFGGVVIWGELWTPGANEATVLEVSDTVTLDGHTVPAGRWSMWVIPSQVGPWELVLDRRDSLYHTQRPEAKDDQVRLPLEVRLDAPHEDALTWSFPRIAQNGATMRMTWATVAIDLEVGVKSIEPVITMKREEAAPYVGEWLVTFVADSSMGPTPPPQVLTITYSDSGLLRASYPPGAFGPPPPRAAEADSNMTPQERERTEAKRKLREIEGGDFSYVLVPKSRGIFMLGWVDDGVLYDVEEFYHEFEFEKDRAVSLTFRNDKDKVMGTAKRVKR